SDGGEAIELTRPPGSVSYHLGDFAGQSMFMLTVPRAGAYRFMCEGEGGTTTVAFVSALGTGIVAAVVGIVGGIAGAILIALLVRRRRRRWDAANAAPA